MQTVYLAIDDETGNVLCAYTSLDLLHRSHKLSCHKLEIESWYQDEKQSVAYLKDGTKNIVDIQMLTIYDDVAHM